MFSLIDKMECNVFSNPEIAIINGGKYFEDLLTLIMDTEAINKEKTSNENINKLKEFGVINYEMKNRFHQARIARNKGVHDNDDKQSYKLCAILFQISVWFYKKYSGNTSFRAPSFDRSLIVEKDKNANKTKTSSNLDEKDMKTIEDIIDEKIKDSLINKGNTSSKEWTDQHSKQYSPNKENSEETKSNEEYSFNFIKTNGSYLLTELSKLKKSSKESVEDSKGFKNEFNKYMHVEREIQHVLKNKLEDLSNTNSSQLIMLSGSAGDGKSHLVSYMKYNFPNLMENFDIHGDATESYDPKLTAIETLTKVLEPFSNENINKSNKKLILSINLGILSDFIDENINSNFSDLCEILNEIDIFNNSTITTNITKDFLTIVNFADYQLYELTENGVSSEFISNLLNKVTNTSDDNPFYLAYKKDKELNIKTPIIYNYEMLMNEDVKQIIIQYLIKSIVKNKKIISTRALLNFIYEILVPANIDTYSDMNDVSKYINDLMPNLLFNSDNRSNILKDLSLLSPANIRSETIDKFIISLNTLQITTVLKTCFEDYDEFKFFKEFLLSNTYSKDKLKQKIIKESLIYYIPFFGNEELKSAFEDDFYDNYLKFLYYYNYQPRKLRKLFNNIKKAIMDWKGSNKHDYIVIEDLPNFTISKRISLDFKPNSDSEVKLKNNFKNSIGFNVHVNNISCCDDYCIGESCTENSCISLNVDYLLFEIINKINKGYKPNKNEKEDLLIFDEFIEEVLSKKGDNELMISYLPTSKFFKFKSLSGNYYTFEGD